MPYILTYCFPELRMHLGNIASYTNYHTYYEKGIIFFTQIVQEPHAVKTKRKTESINCINLKKKFSVYESIGDG